jgi:chemotaxis protein histidine kinase CheA
MSKPVVTLAQLVEREAERLQVGLAQDADRTGLLAEELLGAIQGIRLTPLTSLFPALRRVAHDAARRSGKDVGLELGAERVVFD